MQRLIYGLGENSPEGYDAIFAQRKVQGVDPMDIRRWKKLLRYYRGGKLLDVGCLDSLVPIIAKEKYPESEMWGIDVAEEAIKQMQTLYPDIIYAVDDAYKTKFPNNYFDYVVLGEVLEHLEDPNKAIHEAIRVLKHGGILALSTPEDEAREPGAVDGHRHIWSITVEDVEHMLAGYGRVKVTTLGSQFLPYYVYAWPNILGYLFKK